MSAQENKELVRYVTEEGFNKGNTDFVDEVFAEDFTVHIDGVSLPRGPEAFRAAVAMWRNMARDFRIDIEEMIGDGELVVCKFTATGQHAASFLGIAATDKEFTLRGADVHRVVDGKVVESWISDHITAVLMQIGALVHAEPNPSAWT
ncbi:ester cyclase [Streptomyces sp. NPDC002851]